MTREEQAFSGGIAVITGSGSGIGAGLARRAAEVGMTVVVTDINLDAANGVADSIRAKGGKADALKVDVARPEELDRLADIVFAKYGSVRLLINNAGIETLGFAWEIPTARWEATLNINLHGVVHSVRAFLPKMLESGEECWVGNLSSVGAFGMMPTQTAYTVTKHAVQSFSECLYLEMEVIKAPIHIASIIPGMMKTAIFEAEAGGGEPENAAIHRKTMRDMMANYGMDLEEGCRVILEQVAANKFWCSSQPDMTDDLVAARIAFFESKGNPVLSGMQRQLLGI